VDFEIKRDALSETRFVDSDPPQPEPNQAVLRVDSFGMTANNITYAVMGEAMSYWDFFPASQEGWGRLPVWGFADVAAVGEGVEGLEEGTRLYGYYPASTHLVVEPQSVGEAGFFDGSAHRATLPPVYNRYSNVAADPVYDRGREAEHILFFPLFFTSFLLDDFFGDSDMFGAEAAILSSASSKTASAAAFLLARRGGTDVIALTSPRSADFVGELGVYDGVVTYDDIDSLERRPSVYADMAGDAEVRNALHRRLGDELRHDAVVGMTHHEEMGAVPDDLPGPRPEFFFAPTHAAKRAAEWGGEGLAHRVGEAWRPYVEWTTGWLEVARGSGPDALRSAYLEVLEGRSDPRAGHVLSLSS
jgi:NADPH:quinone reductase-like Zn-dependent oxidoreductase